MSKLVTFVIVPVCVLFLALAGLYAYVEATDPIAQKYRDRIEYPLQQVDAEDTSSYMLVKWQHAPAETYEIVTDTESIKANVSAFSVDNDGSIYGTTPDGLIGLYKDGEHIDSVPFDHHHTKGIEYGTLEFRQINELQYLLLTGQEILEQEEHYTIVYNHHKQKPYYWMFVHGESLTNLETVSLLSAESSLGMLPRPRQAENGVIEFAADYPTYAGAETAHWFFRLSDGKLSQRFLNVRAVQEGKVICTETDSRDPRIIITDIFDKTIFHKSITGDFSKVAGRLFLQSAVFTADGKIQAVYLGADEQTHTGVFPLE